MTKVCLSWKNNAGIETDINYTLYLVNGEDAKYRVKRIVYVFDGLLNLDNPFAYRLGRT